MSAALLFAGASSALDLMGGLFGYFASQESANIAESRGRMLRMESEADAQRYAEQARGFRATQKLAYLKSGVELSGSPLEVLDQTARISAENLSAIRARGAANQLDMEAQASQMRVAGRTALISALSGGLVKMGKGLYNSYDTAGKANPTNDTPTSSGTGGWNSSTNYGGYV